MDVNQAGIAQLAGEQPAVPHIDTLSMQQREQCGMRFQGILCRVDGRVGRHGNRIEFFREQHSSGLKGRYHARQREIPLRQVHENKPAMGEIKRSLRKWVRGDIMPQHFDVWTVEECEVPRVNVGGEDAA